MRYVYHNVIQDGKGNAVSAASVTVTLAGGSTAASIYTAYTGGTVDADGIITSGADGTFTFYVDEDDYSHSQQFRIVWSKSGFTSETWDYIQIFPNSDKTILTDSTVDQGDSSIVGTLAWHITNEAGASCDIKILAGTYDVTTNIEVPITMVLHPDKGVEVDGSGTLQINSYFNPGRYQVFGTSITVTFAISGPDEIHPEWWGTFPNGTNDTTILNKAIAAADTIGDFNEYEQAEIIIKPGRYYVAHNSVTTITSTFLAPGAIFTAVDNSTQTGYLLRFDYSEVASFRQIDIGSVYGKEVLDDVAHYNKGIQILGGDSARVRVGGLHGLYMGIESDASVHGNHVGMWDVEIDTILGCDFAIYLKSGDAANAQVEANRFKIRYLAYCDTAIALESNIASAKNLTGNYFQVGFLELHHRANMLGFYVSGAKTYGNTFIVDGGATLPSGTGFQVTTANSALNNIFELCLIDWTYINPTGGYNIFRALSNHHGASPSTNDYGRSEILLDAAPVSGPWRAGDKVWDNTPSAGGTMGWVCVTSGTPGTWKAFGTIAA